MPTSPKHPQLPGLGGPLRKSGSKSSSPDGIALRQERRRIVSREDILKTLQKGIDKQRAGKLEEAEYFYQLVLRDNPEQPDALNLMGALAADGKLYDVSETFLKKAVKKRPNDSVFLNNLANTYILMDEPRLAMPLLQRALKLSNQHFEASLNLARAQSMLGQATESLQGYREALRKRPGHKSAEIGLARALAASGDLDAAAGLYNEILKKDPNASGAWYGLANVRKFTAVDMDIAERLEQVLRQPGHGGEDLEYLHHAAGKIYNDIRHFDDAFRHFDAAKKLAGSKFDLKAFSSRIDLQMSVFTREFFETRIGWGSDDERPVFIVGMPRSGTTLTEQILSSHPQVYGAGELTDMNRLAKPILNSLIGEAPGKPALLTDARITQAARAYLQVISEMGGQAERITDKMPHNFTYLGLIALMFPKATIIHCQRDPMDNCVSCFTHKFNQIHGYNTDLATLGKYYSEYRRLMNHWSEVIPNTILTVQYEETVSDLEAVARRIVSHARLEWDDACLQFHTSQRDVNTPSMWQVRQPIYKTSMKRWKNYERHLDDLKDGLGDYYEH